MKVTREILMIVVCLAMASLAVAGTLEHQSVHEAHQLLLTSSDQVALLDVRTPGEYVAGHIQGALLFNFNNNDFGRKLSRLPKHFTYVIYGKAGHRSARTARMMKQMGYDVIHMDGGLEEWKRSGFPMVK